MILAVCITLTWAGLGHADLLVNGSFETSSIGPGAIINVPAGSTGITGWTVTWGNIDYLDSSVWQAADGSRSLDLDGVLPGGIAQTFATQPGAQYLVTFYMAGNPTGGPAVKDMGIAAAGQSAEFSFDTTGHSVTNMGWTAKSWTFTANAPTTALEFYSLTGAGYSPWGPALDNVSVRRPVTIPVVSTSPATGVTKILAILNGSITDDGGEACQYRFRYKAEKGDYVYTSWTGSVRTGESFGAAISRLKPNGMYYFNAQAKNSVGESAWGYDQVFVARPGEAPKASFKCEPQQPEPWEDVVFDASKSEDKDGWIVNYAWDFRDDTSAETSSPIYDWFKLYLHPGDYAVRLTVTDNEGLVGTTTSIVKVRIRWVPVPPPAQWKKNGHWYQVVVVAPPGIFWADARAAAAAVRLGRLSGHLATITSAEESDFVFSIAGIAPWAWNQAGGEVMGPWLGASYAPSEGRWQWVTGEPWIYTNWIAGGPDNLQDEEYLLYWGLDHVAPTWNDAHGLAPSYVVEYE